MITAFSKTDFIEEVKEQVEEIAVSEYRNVDMRSVINSLYRATGGDPEGCTSNSIREAIEEEGGESYDASDYETDYDEEDEDPDEHEEEDQDY